jgi:hypothetical protein
MAKANRRRRRAAERETRQDARRDVRLSLRPELRAIDRQEAALRGDYEDFTGQSEGIYDALANELAPLGPAYQEQSQGISSGLEQALADLASSLGLQGMDTPQAETQAALGAYGAVGAGGLSQLASQMQRGLGYQTSAERQTGIEREEVARNLLQGLQDALEGLGDRRLDVTEGMGSLVRQRMDELAEQQLTQQLARSQMQSDRAFSELLSSQIGGLLGGGGGGGGFGPGGGPGPGGPGPGGGAGPNADIPPRGPQGAGPGGNTAGSRGIIEQWLAGALGDDWTEVWEDLRPRQRRRLRGKGYFRGNAPGPGGPNTASGEGPFPRYPPWEYPWGTGR